MPRLACLVLVFGLLLALGASSFAINASAAWYPQILITGALVALTIGLLQERRQPVPVGSDPELAALAAGPAPARTAFGGFVLVWLAFPFVMGVLGFVLSTVIALVLSCLLLRIRRPAVVIASSIVLAVAFAVLLRTVLYVPMPSGWLDQRIDQVIYRMQKN